MGFSGRLPDPRCQTSRKCGSGAFTGSHSTLESQPQPCPTLLPRGISPWSHRRLRPNSRLGSSPAVMDGDLLSCFTHRIIPRPKQMAGYSEGSTKHQRKEFSGTGHSGRRRSLDGSQRVCISCLPRGKQHLLQCEQSLVAKPPAPASDRGRGSAPRYCCSQHYQRSCLQPLHDTPTQTPILLRHQDLALYVLEKDLKLPVMSRKIRMPEH